jgi:hypothetical protein
MICKCGNELDENDVLNMCKKCLSEFVACMGIVKEEVEEIKITIEVVE